MGEYVLIDGRHVNVEHGLRAPTEIRSTATYAFPGSGPRVFNFLASHLEFGRLMSINPAICTGFKVTQEFSFQEGTVWAGEAEPVQEQPGVSYWQGSTSGDWEPQKLYIAVLERGEFSIRTFAYGGDIVLGTEALFDALSHLTISSTPGMGLSMKTDTEGVVVRESAILELDLAGLGTLSVYQRGGVRVSGPPRHQGTAVEHGQLYAGQHANGHTYFVHVGDSFITYLYPEDHQSGNPDTVELLDQLKIEDH